MCHIVVFQKCAITVSKVLDSCCFKCVFVQINNAESLCNGRMQFQNCCLRTLNYKCLYLFIYYFIIFSFHEEVFLFAKHLYCHLTYNVLMEFTKDLRVTLTNLKIKFLLLGEVLCFQWWMCVCMSLYVCAYMCAFVCACVYSSACSWPRSVCDFQGQTISTKL